MKETIRLAIRTVLADGNRVTVDRVRGNGAAGAPIKLIRDTLREHRAGLLDIDQPWSAILDSADGYVPRNLTEAMIKATSYEGIGVACRMVMEACVNGSLSGAKATALKALLGEARQSLKQQHAEKPPEQDDEIVPVSHEAWEVAVLFEGIVSDEGRQRVKDTLKKEVELDLVDNPNTDGART